MSRALGDVVLRIQILTEVTVAEPVPWTERKIGQKYIMIRIFRHACCFRSNVHITYTMASRLRFVSETQSDKVRNSSNILKQKMNVIKTETNPYTCTQFAIIRAIHTL